MRSAGRLEKRRLGNLVHPPILAEDQDGGLVAPKGQAHRVLGNHLGALHLATKIGSEVVYLDKQVFNAS